MTGKFTTHDSAILAAMPSVLGELMAELAATRPLQGPLSVRFGPRNGVHEVIDGHGEVVAVWPVPEVLRRAAEIAGERN